MPDRDREPNRYVGEDPSRGFTAFDVKGDRSEEGST